MTTSDPVNLDAAGAAIADRVGRALPAWVVGRVTFIADAWDRLAPDERAALDARAVVVGERVATHVVDELRALFATPVERQSTTPLAIVRGAVRDVTEVLREAGIPEVERDAFDERSFPDDDYGVTPASLAELGDDELGPLQLAWGLAKAKALRAGKGSE